MQTDTDELILLGAALIGAQKLEFVIYGIAAHTSHISAAKQTRFKSLNAEKFLRGDIEDLKATLGQVYKIFGKSFLIKTSEFDQYIKDRNLIVHNYWRCTRTNLSHGKYRIDDPISFLHSFINKTDELTSVVKGLLVELKNEAAKKENRESENQLTETDQQNLAAYHKHVTKYLREI